jgi:DNA invertase Pin-like site-specific DNA recombinase
MERNMDAYVPYYRVSTDRQGRSGLGLEAQKAAVERYLGSTEGKLLLPAFVEVESGRKNHRPELEKALAKCRTRKATLIVAKVDRLTRSMTFLNKLIEYNVPVVFCDLPQLQGAIGTFMLHQMVAVAQLEAGLISERTKAALAARVAREGQWDRRAKHHLVPGAGQRQAVAAVKENARERARDLVAEIEAVKDAGAISLCAAARALNERGVPSPRGGRWQAITVQRVLNHVTE